MDGPATASIARCVLTPSSGGVEPAAELDLVPAAPGGAGNAAVSEAAFLPEEDRSPSASSESLTWALRPSSPVLFALSPVVEYATPRSSRRHLRYGAVRARGTRSPVPLSHPPGAHAS